LILGLFNHAASTLLGGSYIQSKDRNLIINGEYVRIWKEAVTDYFKVPSQNSLRESKGISINPVRIITIPSRDSKPYLANTKIQLYLHSSFEKDTAEFCLGT
jgi:hypothetical protein